MPPRMPARLARRAALTVAALGLVATGAVVSGTSTSVVDWVAAHDRIDVPYVRDCKGILRRPAECPARPGAGQSSAPR